MNTPPDVMAGARAEAIPAVEIRAVRRLYWSVRRELWENGSLYLAPPAAAALFLFGFFAGLVRLPDRMRAALALSPIERHQAIEQPYVIAAIVLMVVEILVAVFYSLDALYGERRDRSILFWKSLPVSDFMAVLAKASIPILVLPLISFAVTVATQAVMLLVSSAVLAASGVSAASLWERMPVFRLAAINFVHLVGFHGIWYAPLYGWLLMVSAWAKRTPFLWATIPPVAIGVVEKIAFNTSHFATLVQEHFLGGPLPAGSTGGMTMDLLAPDHVMHLLMSSGLWAGLAVTAAFLFAAVWLRRSRGAI